MKGKNYPHQLAIGVPVISDEIIGGNSSVFKGTLTDGSLVAIKEYTGTEERIHRMLNRERTAITFLRENGIENVPEILEIRPDLGLMVFKWIEGKSPLADHETMKAILEMCNSLESLHKRASLFDKAIDSVSSISEVKAQVLKRIDFFQTTYSSMPLQKLCTQVTERMNQYTFTQSQYETSKWRTLSVSDLGTHNILSSESHYIFIDFEFFGEDSVSKLVGDFFLHPRNDFSENEMAWFIDGICKSTNWNPRELEDALPLLALKWAMIAFGRTFREKARDSAGEISSEQIIESKGSLYLDYFDSLLVKKRTDPYLTFRSFECRV